MQTTKSTDLYGNRVEIRTYDDGTSERITFPDDSSYRFEFLGDTYSVAMLRCDNEELKLYYRDRDSEAALQRDGYGRLWLCFYDEYTLSNGDDRYDYLWALVADETDADELVKVPRLSRLRLPYIAYDGERFQAAHEMTEKQKTVIK